MILKQRHFLSTREFELKENGLWWKEKNLAIGYETLIHFENIYPERLSRKKEGKWMPFVTTAFLAIVFLVNLGYLIIGEVTEITYPIIFLSFVFMLGSAFSAYLSITNEILISVINKDSVGQIIFYDRKPSKAEVQAFLTHLEQKGNAYLKEKYSALDFDFPIAPQLDNYAWLKSRNIITDEEFELLKDKALRRTSMSTPIGFKNTSSLN